MRKPSQIADRKAVDTDSRRGHSERMRVSVLGPIEVDGGVIPLAPRDRVVLAVLALRRDQPCRADTIADALWGEGPPDSAAKVVQGCIVRLRKALDAAAIRTTEAGYVLRLHHDEVDVAVFEDLVGRARSLLASGQPDRVRFLADRARLLWRGEPYTDIADWAPALSEIDRLTALRRDVEELSIEAELALGLHEQAVPELVRLVRVEPDREHRWALLALAQYRSGRQGEAFSTLQQARSHLVSSLGVDPGQELSTLVEAILRQDPLLDAVTSTLSIGADVCPYPGLAPYEAADAETFFGRDDDVAACLRRLEEKGVVTLVGPSGCGKSSVLRAGIAATFLSDGHRVEVLTPGPRPVAAFDERTLGPNVVLVVDQGEETFSAPMEEARAFLMTLVGHVRGGGLLALAVRADRMGELANHPETARLVEEGLILLGPLTEDGLRRCIEGPAAQAGLHIEAGLVELLVHDVLGEPGALPLLSHVLRRTWEHREGRTLTVAGYRATGGVRGAVAQSAEALFRGLSEAEQTALRELMTRLVGLDDRGDLVRQRVARESVSTDETHTGVIGRLVEARLVSVDGDAVEISHESLAVAWPRLRSWLDEDVDGIRIMRHLSVAATSWAALGRPASELYRGARQARATEWSDRMRPALSAVEREFLDASTGLALLEEQAAVAEARRERLQNRRLRAGLALVGALLIASLVAGSVAFSASGEARAQALAADARLLGAEALRAKDVDTGLLLAAAGVALHDDVHTRANLLAALDQRPALLRAARIPRAAMVAVGPSTGHVFVAAPLGALLVRHPDSLAEVATHASLAGAAVVAGVTDGGAAAAVRSDLIGSGSPPLPPVVLLDETGASASSQLGGIPEGRYVVQTLSLTPDGRWLVMEMLDIEGAEPPQLGVWDLESPSTPVAVLELEGQTDSPIVLDEGRSLLYLFEGELYVRDLPSGEIREVLAASDLQTRLLYGPLAVSPAGDLLVVVAAGELLLVDVATWLPVHHIAEVGVDDIAFSADGRHLGVGGDDVVVWDLTGTEPFELLRQRDSGGWVAFSRDGDTLYSADWDGLLLAWDLSGQRGVLPAARPPSAPVPFLPHISPDGTRVLHVKGWPEPALHIRDIATGEVTTRIDADQGPTYSQGSTTYVDSAWSPDGRVVTMTTGDPRVSLWDSRTGDVIVTTDLPDGERVSFSVYTRDGASLLVGTTTGRLHVLDASTLVAQTAPLLVAPEETLPDQRAVQALEPGPDNHVLVMLDNETFVADHRARTIDPIGVDVHAAGWSPDGERIFVTVEDGTVGLLDALTRQWISGPSAVQPLAGGTVSYSLDGTKVATSASGRVGVWDGETGDFLGAVSVASATATRFTSDGGSVIIAGDDGAVRTWSLDTAAWIDAACRMAGRALTEQEWRTHLPDRDYIPACDGLDPPPEAAAQPRRAGREEVEKATAPPERRAG